MKPKLDVISSTMFVVLKTVFPKKKRCLCGGGGSVPSGLLLACENANRERLKVFWFSFDLRETNHSGWRDQKDADSRLRRSKANRFDILSCLASISPAEVNA